MTDRRVISERMREHYEKFWQQGDAWDLESSPYEQARYDCQLEMLAGRRYGRALEIGCGSGCFTRRLAGIAGRVLALDIAEAAIERARVQASGAGPGTIELRAADVMEFDFQAEAPWDLVVLGETIYCLAWLYPFFDVGYLAARLFEAVRPGGRFLLTNTYGQQGKDWLLCPWLVHTYRDLIRNVGFRLEAEETFRGVKDGVDFQVLMSLFVKPHAGG